MDPPGEPAPSGGNQAGSPPPGGDVGPAAGEPARADPATSFDLDKEFPEFTGWESIGFHRGLGREFWQIAIELLTSSLGIIMISLLMPIENPFPEIGGYQGVAWGLFAVVYTIFDTGTNFGLNRFIAEYRVKDTRKMLQYISFTFWYQAWTGLVQISLLSWFTFQVLVTSNFAYLTWVLLLGLIRQYPGALGIFKSTLEGMQHFNKVEILNFFQGEIAHRFSVIGTIIAFRLYTEEQVSYGILMGIIFGHMVGSYVVEIVFAFISAHFLDTTLKRYYRLSIRDVFLAKYSRDVVRNILFYGLQGSALPIIGSFVGTFTLLTMVGNVNAYTTWTALVGTGMGFAGQLNQFGDFALQTSIAEAYPSGKQRLAEFYVTYSVRWRMMFMIMLAAVTLAIIPFFVVVVRELGAYQYYQGAEIFIIPGIINRFLWVIIGIPDAIMWGALHITQHTVIRIFEEFLKILFVWFFVVVLRIHETWGLFGITYLFGFQHFVPIMIKTAMCLFYVKKRILTVRIYSMSTFIVPAIASLPVFGIAQFWYHIVFFPLKAAIGLELSIAVSIALFFMIVLFTYFPIGALLGGFDDYQLFVLKKAIALSGPSKPILKIVEKIVDRSVDVSRRLKLHGRFPIPHEDAHAEMRELMIMKRTDMQRNV